MEDQLTPDPDAARLRDMMHEQVDVQRTILEETIRSGMAGTLLESGRTLCGDDIQGPVARLPTAVELSECPFGGESGAWHTHVTESELRSPQNSIVDMAIVTFTPLDVISVVGTDSAEYITTATDQGAMADRFRDAMGRDVFSVADVTAAIESGLDVRQAEDDIRRALSRLISRKPTGYTDLAQRIPQIDPPTLPAASRYALREVGVGAPRAPIDTGGPLRKFQTQSNRCTRRAESVAATALPNNVDVGGTAAGAAIGTLAGTLTERLIFD